MKRDMDLVRKVLVRLEAAEGGKLALKNLPAEYGEKEQS